jgi:hypothetical protein
MIDTEQVTDGVSPATAHSSTTVLVTTAYRSVHTS